ncbi:uncharacterized protein LOC116024467 [Ipomoea triloba]|uniref:uncharacterized protein LOC116024467 n=1 Tax=Ipomoea triloba TaxID=35885 RepID=UPI00125DA238|nr:uncharacterized protein LOC116024467 [Ipomoea triloba]
MFTWVEFEGNVDAAGIVSEEGGSDHNIGGEQDTEDGIEVEADSGFESDYYSENETDISIGSEHITSGSEHLSSDSEQRTVCGSKDKSKRKVRVDEEPIPQSVPVGENPLEDDADSQYYDSQDPPTAEEALENEEGDEVQSKYNSKYPRYNPKADPPILELGWEERTKCFQVKAIMLDHKCNTQFTLGIVSQKWLEWKFEEKVRQNPTIGYSELSRDIKSEFNINVTVSMCRRAITGILKKLDIGYESQFKRLRDYAQECLNSNPGSTVKIKTNRTVENCPIVFERIYVCFSAMKKGFLGGCRRFIGLDGCFLKGKLKGEILSAVGRDVNNQMYPIAWAVVEIENSSSWRWFLEFLKSDLEIVDASQWTVMSDQQKGLSSIIQEVFPGVEHRNCARHVHANWSKSHRGKVLKGLFWQIAKTPNQALLADRLKGLEKVDAAALQDLNKYPMQFWCKTFFKEEIKCDLVDNNLNEAFNKTLLNARSKNIIPMLEDIRVAVMKRIAKKRSLAERWTGNNCPNVIKKLNENIIGSADWEVVFNGADGYEVKKGRFQFKINLELQSCSCRQWQLTGLPCPHSICAIFHKGHQLDQYIHEWYSKEMYMKTYDHVIQPMNGEQFWPRTSGDEIHAPIPRKMTSRPKKKRKLEDDEKNKDKNKLSVEVRKLSRK